jgi:UbiD family decarboxylase
VSFNDLRTFLDSLESQGELVRVKKEVSPHEVSAIIWETNERKGPA